MNHEEVTVIVWSVFTCFVVTIAGLLLLFWWTLRGKP